MKKVPDLLFCCYCCSWPLIHVFRWIHHPIPWLNSYLTNFAAVPLMAHIALFLIRKRIVHNDHYYLPLSYVFFIAVYTSVVFEGVMPALSVRYTRDTGDVAAYLLGALFYYFIHQRTCRCRIRNMSSPDALTGASY